MKKLDISIIVFSTNSERVLARALQSCEFADELIVVDTSSGDKSIAVAKQYTKKVHKIPFTLYVEPVRQKVLKFASHDWVFFLDADEELPITLIPILEKTMAMDVVAANVPRKNVIFHKWMEHTGYWPDYNIRFFKKDFISWHEAIHSKPTVTGGVYDMPLNVDNAIIHHHYISVSEYLDKMNRYTTIQAGESGNQFFWQNIFSKPTGEFLKRFFYWEGYLDGIHGLAVSALSSIYILIVELKKWELQKFVEPQDAIQLTEFVFEVKKAIKEIGYWVTQALLKATHSLPQKLLLKIRRRLMK